MQQLLVSLYILIIFGLKSEGRLFSRVQVTNHYCNRFRDVISQLFFIFFAFLPTTYVVQGKVTFSQVSVIRLGMGDHGPGFRSMVGGIGQKERYRRDVGVRSIHFMKVWSWSVKDWSRYWWKCAVRVQTNSPLFDCLKKVSPYCKVLKSIH